MRALGFNRWWLAIVACAVAGALATAGSLRASAVNAADRPNDAYVTIVKVIDLDGDLETTNDQYHAEHPHDMLEGWEFDISVTNGYADPSVVVTTNYGLAYSDIFFDELGPDDDVFVEITEEVKPGFELIDWECYAEEDLRSSDVRQDFSSSDTGPIQVWHDWYVVCYFYNTPTDEKGTPTPTVRPRTATPEPTEPPPATATPPAPTSTPAGEPAGVVIPPQPPAPVAPVALPSTGSGPDGGSFPWLTAGVLAALTLAGAGFALRRRRA